MKEEASKKNMSINREEEGEKETKEEEENERKV